MVQVGGWSLRMVLAITGNGAGASAERERRVIMDDTPKSKKTTRQDGSGQSTIIDLLAYLHEDGANLNKQDGVRCEYLPLKDGRLALIISYPGHRLSASNGKPTIDGQVVS